MHARWLSAQTSHIWDAMFVDDSIKNRLPSCHSQNDLKIHCKIPTSKHLFVKDPMSSTRTGKEFGMELPLSSRKNTLLLPYPRLLIHPPYSSGLAAWIPRRQCAGCLGVDAATGGSPLFCCNRLSMALFVGAKCWDWADSEFFTSSTWPLPTRSSPIPPLLF